MGIGDTSARALGKYPDPPVAVPSPFGERRIGGVAPIFGQQDSRDERGVRR
ncbi:MAG TPA: hypothetical protein VGQ56_18955 [Gemmatimonadaceae bacterium]|nr:hypothetical protein [Gemmatimonadaceae bacterium]